MENVIHINEELIGNDATDDEANVLVDYLNTWAAKLRYLTADGDVFEFDHPDDMPFFRYGPANLGELNVRDDSWNDAISCCFCHGESE